MWLEMEKTHNNQDNSLLLETVMLEGEIMLQSGAEVYRVEDTMRRILDCFGFDPDYMLVITTGIVLSLHDGNNSPVTMVKRIHQRSANISRICGVNTVSRDLCSGTIDLSEANKRLKEIKCEKHYNKFVHSVGIVGVAAFFVVMFGGTGIDFAGGLAVGSIYAAADYLLSKTRFNDFIITSLNASIIAISAFLLSAFVLHGSNPDTMIMGAIMPLVPGVPFATAIRDMLNGDYSSGTARIMEAVVIALAVATGVGCGIILAGLFIS